MSRPWVGVLALGLSTGLGVPAGAVPRGAQAAATSDVGPQQVLPDARLRRSDGELVQLSRFRGRPVVLFYEDRHSLKLNQALKEQLFDRGRSAGLLRAVSLLAVANLEAYDFFPARGIALSFVRDAEKKVGVPILVDLDGVLSQEPWWLPGKSSSVVLLDRTGAEVFRASGALTPGETERFFAALGGLLGKDLTALQERP
jgi:hypothetical protein